MRRFFVSPEELIQGHEVILSGDEFHHLKNVSRLEEGEFVELLDGKGRIAKAQIDSIGKKSASLTVDVIEALPPSPAPRIHLVLSLPKPQTLDLILQKIVELDVDQITPVVSDRSFFRKIDGAINSKFARWEKIALQACKQCGRAWPLVLNEAVDLMSAINQCDPATGLFLYEGDSSCDIKTALQKLPRDLKAVTVFIGSEGGFSVREVETFNQKGLKPVTLGSLVLRVETACIAAPTVIKYEFDRLR